MQYYYDALNQLTRVNDHRASVNKTTVYSYDAGGNITAKTEYAYTTSDTLGTPTRTYSYTYYATWKDRLASYDGITVSSDGSGNTRTYGDWTYSWQGRQQLTGLTKTGINLAFTYNKDNIRTSKTYNGVKTTYSLIGNKITGQYNGTDTMYFRYDSSDNLVGFSLNNVDYIYIKNVQGDIIAIADTSGNVVVEYTYDAWGQVLATTGSAAATVGAKNPFLFKGYYYDIESGLYYLQSRYYNPSWGRFVNADDARITLLRMNCSNIFIYCNNNPQNYMDLTGYTPVPILQNKLYKFTLKKYFKSYLTCWLSRSVEQAVVTVSADVSATISTQFGFSAEQISAMAGLALTVKVGAQISLTIKPDQKKPGWKYWRVVLKTDAKAYMLYFLLFDNLTYIIDVITVWGVFGHWDYLTVTGASTWYYEPISRSENTYLEIEYKNV